MTRTWAGAMKRGASLIEEEMVGENLVVSKPMRFKVGAACLHKFGCTAVPVQHYKECVIQ